MRLVGLRQSPWTEKARWALDHHELAHEYVEHRPVLGEPALRLRLKDARGRVTVPVLFTRHGALRTSAAIADFADRIGRAPSLFPKAHRDAIRRWDARSEEALVLVRNLYAGALGQSREALAESAPPLLPSPLRGPLASLGFRLFALKYGLGVPDQGQDERALASILEGLREALEAGGSAYLLGEFTYADVAMAVVLHGVRPADDAWVPLPPATRACWTRPALAARFADLLAWRDALYARHGGVRRGEPGGRAAGGSG